MSSSFLETADRLGARICRDAIWAGGRCNWIAGYIESASTIVHRALGPDVYSGTSGIALFLFRLFEVTGEKIFRMTAEAALGQALSREDELRRGRVYGFFDGLSGIAYVAAQAGRISEAFRLVRELPSEDSRLDIINGSAGAIGALLSLHRQSGEAWLLQDACHHSHILLRAADRGEAGWSWKTVAGDSPNLTGFAHGAAGIAWALLEMFQATGVTEFRHAALEAFRYESSHFDAEAQNWPDFRYPPDKGSKKPPTAVMWCHGAPGIGLARLRAWQILGEECLREEAETALRTTSRWLDANADANFSLCHGRAGNAGLLHWAGRVLGNDGYVAQARRVGESGIRCYEDERIPWPCGVQGGDETPDLMLGLAGIAWFYLMLSGVESGFLSCVG